MVKGKRIMIEKIFLKHYRFRKGYDHLIANPGNEISAKGGITIAIGKTKSNDFFTSFAICHPSDNFRKKTGSNRASGMLSSINYVYEINNHDFYHLGKIDFKAVSLFCDRLASRLSRNKSRQEIKFMIEDVVRVDLPF